MKHTGAKNRRYTDNYWQCVPTRVRFLCFWGRYPRSAIPRKFAREGAAVSSCGVKGSDHPLPSPRQSAKADLAAGTSPRQSAKADLAAGTSPRRSAKADLAAGTSPRQSAKADFAAGTSPRRSAKAGLPAGTSPRQSAKADLPAGTSPRRSAKADLPAGTSPRRSAKAPSGDPPAGHTGPPGVRGRRGAQGRPGARGCRGTRGRRVGGAAGAYGAADENALLLMRVGPFAWSRRIKNNAETTAFLILLFGPRRVMYVSRAGKRAAAGEGPAGTKRERSTPRENTDFWH